MKKRDVVLIRDGTIVGPKGTEIDLRTPSYDVWVTVKSDSDPKAEAVVAALIAAFPGSKE